MSEPTTAPVTADDATYRFLEAIQVARSCKGPAAEWQPEDELLEAASLIVRARLGRTVVRDPLGLARWRIDRALKALEAEENER